ncbi:MAG: AAA family ATPase [Bacteroidales bacterium]|nr:AAA family ATPase [Bacteroidales bacterium]
MAKIVGRKDEIQEFEKLYNSGKPEFVAVYGRRRVGKTFLIKQIFKDRLTFQHTGVSPVDSQNDKNRMKTQLESFYYDLLESGLEGFAMPKTWLEAFFQLRQLLIKLDNGNRQVIFLDELPWMDTPRSGFLAAFENFWNGWCSSRDNLMLIVCGSAASWILSNISRSKGGLYGRLTSEIKLLPFSLKECEDFFRESEIELSRYDIVQAYMVFGGIPYYLSYFAKGQSFEGNVDKMLFGKNLRLKDEFNRLFNAVFVNAEDSKKIVRLLAKRHSGYSRDEISKLADISYGGGLTSALSGLEESGFVFRYQPYGKKGKSDTYKLTDNFCLFWLKYVEPNSSNGSFMKDNMTAQIMQNWRGVAFEEVCFQHVTQICKALEIGGVKSEVSAWNFQDGESQGAQIDLLIFRADNVVNLCEIKFSSSPYVIDKDEEMKLRNRIETLKTTLKAKQTVHLTMITTYGIKFNIHSGIVQRQVVMEDLFV